jgi:Secretion system C-terminal sorting domain
MKLLKTLFLIALIINIKSSYSQISKIELSTEQLSDLQNIPELEIKSLKKTGLPLSVNNAEQKFFPGLISQVGYSCGQVSGVGYVFTYEMNCLNDGDASLLENQYNYLFTYNMLNNGSAVKGVSYLDSWKIIQELGQPSKNEFNINISTNRWMSGYNNYHKSMQNRIDEIYSIRLNTEEGILKLKNWLYNHAGESEFGGIACIYSSFESADFLPEGTPEAGKYVYTELNEYPNHSWAIVGYDDEIKYDYNGDGIYTNNIDLNNDGLIDVNDWEIGGVIFSNTYTDPLCPDGLAYCMYKALANNPELGAPFNNLAHVIKVKKDYDPKLSLKVKLKHDSRNKIKILVGYSENIESERAEVLKESHIFNYQGGNYSMNGGISEDAFELGLDISQFYYQATPNKEIKVFVYVIEKEQYNYSGEIQDIELLNYEDNSIIAKMQEGFVEIKDNDTTIISFDVELDNTSKLEISGNNLPITHQNEYFEQELDAIGGITPYQWEIIPENKYETELIYNLDSYVHSEDITFNGSYYKHVKMKLPFTFPYYDKTYDSIYVTTNGTILFDKDFFTELYVSFHEENLSKHAVILPFGLHSLFFSSAYDFVKYVATDEYFSVYWNLSNMYISNNIKFIFETTLYKNGDIDFKYHNLTDEWTKWIGGISNGDGNYTLSPLSNDYFIPDSITVRFKRPEEHFSNISITKDGLVSGTPSATGNKKVKIKVTDYTGAYDIKEFNYITWPTEIDNIDQNINKVKCYPNPAEEILYINIENEIIDLNKIEIFNLIGQKIHSQSIINQSNRIIIPLNEKTFKSGIYILKLSGQNLTFENKFIKK